KIGAKRIIIATGSRPVLPKPWSRFGDRILTSDTLFEQTDLPRRIAVIGLGALGLELAQALSRLGLEIRGFDAGDKLAGLSDPEVATALSRAIESEFELHLGVTVQIDEDGKGAGLIVSGADASHRVDAVLAAL